MCRNFESYDSDREHVWGYDQMGLAVVDVDDRSSKSGIYKLTNRTLQAMGKM